jgi:hypothetical protein
MTSLMSHLILRSHVSDLEYHLIQPVYQIGAANVVKLLREPLPCRAVLVVFVVFVEAGQNFTLNVDP